MENFVIVLMFVLKLPKQRATPNAQRCRRNSKQHWKEFYASIILSIFPLAFLSTHAVHIYLDIHVCSTPYTRAVQICLDTGRARQSWVNCGVERWKIPTERRLHATKYYISKQKQLQQIHKTNTHKHAITRTHTEGPIAAFCGQTQIFRKRNASYT